MRAIGFGGLYPGMVGMSRGRRSSGGGSGMTGVTKDAASGIYAPANATEWTTTKSASSIPGNPSNLWLLQDAASPAADAIGAITLATGGTAGTFGVAQTGWTRKGWQSPGDGVAGRLLSTNVALPDPTATSSLLLAYVAILSTPAAERQVLTCTGTGTAIYGAITSTSVAKVHDSVANSATGTADVGAVVRPWVIKYDHTASVTTLYTDQEKLSPTYVTGIGKAVTIGYLNATSPSMWCGYAALFTGSAAEMTDAQVKALLTTLGWTVGWA